MKPDTAISRLLVNTMPRSGTRYVLDVLARLFDLQVIDCRFTGGPHATPPNWNSYDEDETYSTLQPGQAVHSHCPCSLKVARFSDQPGALIVYAYRDPRDVCVSAALFIKYRATTHPFHNLFACLTEAECITLMLAGFRIPVAELAYQPPASDCDHIAFAGMTYFCQRVYPWLADPRTCTLRFEDIVAAPIEALTEALDHAGAAYDRQRLAALLDGFVIRSGGRTAGHEDKSAHYRKGIVHDYRNYFTPAHRALCKSQIGDDLVRLGYETGYNWT